MEIIEKSLSDISQQATDAIHKQRLTVARAVEDVAKSSLNAAKGLDEQFVSAFPDILNLGTTNPAAFNPQLVVEVKEGKGVGVVDVWDNIRGFLPDRRVMGLYHIDIGSTSFTACAGKYICLSGQLMYPNSCSCSNWQACGHSLKCGCTKAFSCNHLDVPSVASCLNSPALNFPSIKRKEERPLFLATATQTFEVDNYLNLFHPASGLYLLFNKTAFPSFPFMTKGERVFQSKQVSALDMTFTNYASVDARPKILQDVAGLIPSDYSAIFTYFDSFRRLPHFTVGVSLDEKVEGAEDATKKDSRDRLIDELQSRLTQALKQIALSESIHGELQELYKKQSVELVDLTRKLHSLEASSNIRHKEETEALKTDNFALKKQLADAMAYQARNVALGEDLDVAMKRAEASQLEVQRIKDVNKSLTDQIIQMKREARTASDELAQKTDSSSRHLALQTRLQDEKEALSKELDQMRVKVHELDSRLLKMTSEPLSARNTLEEALSVRCEELQVEKKRVEDSKVEVEKKCRTLEDELHRLKTNLGALLGAAEPVARVGALLGAAVPVTRVVDRRTGK